MPNFIKNNTKLIPSDLGEVQYYNSFHDSNDWTLNPILRTQFTNDDIEAANITDEFQDMDAEYICDVVPRVFVIATWDLRPLGEQVPLTVRNRIQDTGNIVSINNDVGQNGNAAETDVLITSAIQATEMDGVAQTAGNEIEAFGKRTTGTLNTTDRGKFIARMNHDGVEFQDSGDNGRTLATLQEVWLL